MPVAPETVPLGTVPNGTVVATASVEYEPDEEEILADLLPRNVSVQLLRAQRENAASEQGSKMTAMDNATRNAGDMINKLTIQYNRTRQAAITTELIEIIAGAEAL
jgi:F-type H+-transporting ATPase subunit gamma